MAKNRFSAEWGPTETEKKGSTARDKYKFTQDRLEAWFKSKEAQKIFTGALEYHDSPILPVVVEDLMKWSYLSGYQDGLENLLEREYGKQNDDGQSGSS